MSQVRFLKNWNNKLNNDYFLTIRLWTPSKHRYYLSQQMNFEKVNVLVDDELYCRAKLICMNTDILKNIPEWACYVDSGYSKSKFYKLLENFYKNKKN